MTIINNYNFEAKSQTEKVGFEVARFRIKKRLAKKVLAISESSYKQMHPKDNRVLIVAAELIYLIEIDQTKRLDSNNAVNQPMFPIVEHVNTVAHSKFKSFMIENGIPSKDLQCHILNLPPVQLLLNDFWDEYKD